MCETREKSNVVSETSTEKRQKVRMPQRQVGARPWMLVRIVNLF